MEEINKLSEIVGFKVPLDGFLSAKFGKRIIDLINFDKKLESRFHDYNNMSLQDFITMKFGPEALSIFEKYSS